MGKNRGTMALIVSCAMAAIIILASFFLLAVERTSLHIWALVFILIGDAVFCSGMIIAGFLGEKYNKLFVRTGISVISIGYFLAAVISSLCCNYFKENVNHFILLEIVLLGVSGILFIAVLAAAGKIHDTDKKALEKMETDEINQPKRGGF